MRKAILILLCVLIKGITGKAQTAYQDPAVNDAYVNPNPVSSVGSQFDMVFELGNNGFDPISGADGMNQISFTLALNKCDPSVGGVISAVGVDALSGPALSYFDITYNQALNTYSGHQKAGISIDAFSVFDLVIHGQVTQLSNYSGDNSIGGHLTITPDGASVSFNDLTNDNGEALTRTTVFTTLPEVLKSFTADAGDCKQTQISWYTETEQNMSHFDIEYSADAVSFSGIKTVPAKNNAAGSSYSATINGTDARGYFRLKMVDVNGIAIYSPIRSVSGKCALSEITVNPNPVIGNKATVNGMAGECTVNLFDMNGRILLHVITVASTLDIDFSGYAAGFYIVRVIPHNGLIQSFKVSIP